MANGTIEVTPGQVIFINAGGAGAPYTTFKGGRESRLKSLWHSPPPPPLTSRPSPSHSLPPPIVPRHIAGGGYGGGGDGCLGDSFGGSGGGGGTDIRLSDGSGIRSLHSRVIVAGGGGGNG